MIHDLKIYPSYFEPLINGLKPFEIRENRDRNFQIYDVLVLREHDIHGYSGRESIQLVTYITDYEQKPGYVVMGLRKIQ